MDPRKARKTLEEITLIRNSQGKLDRNSDWAKEREMIIELFVHSIRNQMPNIRNGIVKSKMALKSPIINSLHHKSVLTTEAAQRIAWELFPKQFSKETREYVLGVENDPFYDNHEQYLLNDSIRVSIDSQKASAEKAYRYLLRNMRSCYFVKDHQESHAKARSQQ